MSGPVSGKGQVKWFNNAQGYGFILDPDGNEIFVHHRAIQHDGYRTLAAGQKVDYTAVRGDKGWYATDVRKRGASPV